MPASLRRAHTAAAVLLVVAAMLCAPVGAAAAAPRLIVGFTGDTPASAQRAEVGRAGLRAAATMPSLDAVVVAVPRDELHATRQQLLRRPDVAYVEIDHVARAYDTTASTPGSAELWRPNDTFLTQQWALATMGAERAWGSGTGEGTTIAILDTGVDYIHPDLAGRVDLGRDFVDADDDPMDTQGHGTHVAGIAAASANDGFGIAGMAPGARILAVRVLDDQGAGNYSHVANGILHATSRGADVINLSLGGPQESLLLRDAIDHAAARGVVVTCATGNEGATSIGYPARYDSCLAVGASDQSDRRAAFSNHGAGIDLVAPGAQVLSTTVGGAHDAWDGTSMATPYAAGVAALAAAQGLSRREVVATLTGTARDIGAPGPDARHGAGRLDAAAALEAASRRQRTTADTAAPRVAAPVLLPLRRTTTTTWSMAWKLRSRSSFRRVGTSREPGSVTWTRRSLVGDRRTTSTFRLADGIVYRRTTVHVKVRTPRRSSVVTVPVRVDATDDVAVDRVAVEVDGRTRGVDWSSDGGWVVLVECRGGAHTFTARAWDAADNGGESSVRRVVRC